MAKFNQKYLQFIFISIIVIFAVLPLLPSAGMIETKTIITAVTIITLCGFNFYFFYLFLIPNLLIKKKIALFWSITVIFIGTFPFLWLGIFKFIDVILGKSYYETGANFVSAFLYTILFTLFAGFFRMAVEWFRDFERKKELENKTVKSELALLRSQINPHFLFNTLNNIHTYAYVDPEMTAYSIEKLSDIMRYMLYESNTDKVFLEREIEYIKSYIDLLNLKFKEKDFVQFNINGDVSGKRITPMILIPFVENAFKHGKKRIAHPGIVVNLQINSEKLEFDVTNHVPEKVTVKDENGGIGLQNISRRLELLYPNKHELVIEESENKFFVKLTIQE